MTPVVVVAAADEGYLQQHLEMRLEVFAKASSWPDKQTDTQWPILLLRQLAHTGAAKQIGYFEVIVELLAPSAVASIH